MDLVDEQDLALAQRGQDGGEVPGPLDRRPAGDPQRRTELSSDDHGERGLAEPGRAREQDVIGCPAAAQGAFEHQRELLSDAVLADELAELPGPQCSLDHPVVGICQRGDDPVSGSPRNHGAGNHRAGIAGKAPHGRPSTRSAARSASATSMSAGPLSSGSVSSGSTAVIA